MPTFGNRPLKPIPNSLSFGQKRGTIGNLLSKETLNKTILVLSDNTNRGSPSKVIRARIYINFDDIFEG